MFGFTDIRVELSTRPEDYMGNMQDWNVAEEALKKALETANIEYQHNEGDGAFYGPKIDFHICDCMKRTWQCCTIQLDFAMPQTLDLEYVDADDRRKKPVMIHRAIFGSLERFIGILIEHFAGDFPLWLAPKQAVIIPISKKFMGYAEKINKKLIQNNIRSEIDARDEKVGKKIRDGETSRIPYMLVVGEKEEKNNGVSLRRRKHGDLGTRNVDELAAQLKEEIAGRRLPNP
jgi:threonyl-tRNA synthetase